MRQVHPNLSLRPVLMIARYVIRLRIRELLLLACVSGLAIATIAAAETPRVRPAAPNPDEVIELSPFTVNTSRDLGYQAENTLAGSRFNTQLRDTASSVSVFTKEFLDDLAITDLRELVPYSVNAEMDTAANRSNPEQNPFVNAQRLVPSVLIRGLLASQGMDFFTSITPDDPYRVSRYEDSRGPNSILFGIGAPGGLLNQSSKIATTGRDRGSVRYSFGSWDRSRIEFDANKILWANRLALSLAAVRQENGGWRAYDFRDKKRIFGSLTFQPTRTLTFTAMGETGRDQAAVIRSTVDSDEVLAWYDNRNALGVRAVTFAPGTALPTAAMQAVGVVGRDGQRTATNHRAIFIENDRSIFDAIGTFVTGSYNNAGVRAPDGTPGTTGSVLRLNDPAFYPHHLNAAGPGMYRDQKLKNFTLTLDWQATAKLSFNLAHNYQDTTATVYMMSGTDPTLRGDANTTLGIGGAPNPYAGRLYFDGNWRRDVHTGTSNETRLSASYHLTPTPKWLGRHRIAAMVSRGEQKERRANSWLALAGRPYNKAANNINNRLTVRNYLEEGNYGTYRVGDWRRVPSTVNFDGKSYGLVFANELDGANNSGGDQEAKSALVVMQSHLLDNRLVTTVGYREDRVKVYELGYYDDPLIGPIVDSDRSKGTLTRATGRTGTAGLVYHVTPAVSLIANRSSNQGVPSFVRKVFPDGRLAPSSHGKGQDYGLGFDLFGGKVNAKVVYFTSTETGRVDTIGFGGAAARNTRVMDAFAGALVGPGLPIAASQWPAIYSAYTPPATAATSDYDAKGYEARVTANLTPNWRLVANYSYTDSGQTNLAPELAQWYGLKPADSVHMVQGASQDPNGGWHVDPGAYLAGGAVAKWIELGALHPNAALGTLTTTNGQTVAQEIYNLVDALNQAREDNIKRWGVRPHKVSLFTAYDLKTGRLKGFTIGGGWRWRSANIIGSNSRGQEITGRALSSTDLMLGYSTKLRRLPGRLHFQINVSNVFDRTDIIPVRLATSAKAQDGFILPGGRGLAYSRYDLVDPREIRCTTTYSF